MTFLIEHFSYLERMKPSRACLERQRTEQGSDYSLKTKLGGQGTHSVCPQLSGQINKLVLCKAQKTHEELINETAGPLHVVPENTRLHRCEWIVSSHPGGRDGQRSASQEEVAVGRSHSSTQHRLTGTCFFQNSGSPWFGPDSNDAGA